MKKTFVIYTDQLDILNEMTDEQAGKLIKYIYMFQSGIDFEITDLALKLAFIPFKNQFARDSEKYIKKCETNRLNALGKGRPKKNRDQDENESKATESETKRSKTIESETKQTKAKKSETKRSKTIENEIPKEIPSFPEILEYCQKNSKAEIDSFKLEMKYKSYVLDGWKDGNGKPIKNVKSKFLNLIPYMLKDGKTSNNEKSAAIFSESNAIEKARQLFSGGD